jgi:hypothetical protein
MVVHSLFWRDDWQSNVVDVFRTEVDVVLAGQFLFRSKKSVTCEQNFGCCRFASTYLSSGPVCLKIPEP